MERHLGRVAVVTGASAGIGAAIATRLAAVHGMKVVACARRMDRLKQMADKINNGTMEETFFPYKCDLLEMDEIKAMFEWINSRFGRLDVAVCNAGFMAYGNLVDQTPEDWRKMSDINVISASYSAQLASKIMLEKHVSGNIIFINSMAGHIENDNPMTAFYNSTKHALTTLIEAWRVEVSIMKNYFLNVYIIFIHI
jgi:NAD(P)-dependent dehydrogenase (short-subunit alcohol dehydrogenase family)